MKYIITGSTGHISKPVTQKLIKAGHEVTVITSNSSKVEEIKSLGAQPAVGSVEDRNFLIKTFEGADAVYLMIPPNYVTKHIDWASQVREVADNYIAATEANHIKYVVILSSTGAHYGKDMGPVDGYAYLEEESKKLTQSNIYILRPSSFHYNLFGQIPTIKKMGIVMSSQPADFKMVIVHTSDIADVAAARLLELNFVGTDNMEYIASDDSHTWTEITAVLGAAIGKPDLRFVEITDEQFLNGLLGAGLSKAIANGLVEMAKSQREGKAMEDYWDNRPKNLGKRNLNVIAEEFAAIYEATN